jgi:hypothetical protein
MLLKRMRAKIQPSDKRILDSPQDVISCANRTAGLPTPIGKMIGAIDQKREIKFATFC